MGYCTHKQAYAKNSKFSSSDLLALSSGCLLFHTILIHWQFKLSLASQNELPKRSRTWLVRLSRTMPPTLACLKHTWWFCRTARNSTGHTAPAVLVSLALRYVAYHSQSSKCCSSCSAYSLPASGYRGSPARRC